MNPSITSADTRAYTHEKAVMWTTRPEYMPRGRTTLQTGHSASSLQAEPQVRPIHYKTSVSGESAREPSCSPALDPSASQNPPTRSQIKLRSGAVTSRGSAGLHLQLAAQKALLPCKQP
ncbi:unnamed protein product [Rangifer tarandus platyrhynchus]|uniref:Uncharacterized protein n=2 Tax=Rangifer tarandus platyrhynchus TaxID=3082113 RepID=A0ABN8Z5A6_RANTA|nr:unnamed protein product [Rangifer tarandus platyrhynchus]